MKKQINYIAIFFLGITFIGTGVVFMSAVNSGLGSAFIGLGVLFMVIGRTNKGKWDKKWTKEEE